MRVLGIDPGYGIVGWAVVDEKLAVHGCGAIETPGGTALDERLLTIHRSLGEIIGKYNPDRAAVEKLFFSKNTSTAMDVAKAIGVILLTLKLYGIDHVEYTPVQVKRAITGYGRAGKEQMQSMISIICNTRAGFTRDDVADAISIAACHCLAAGSPRARAGNAR